MDIAFKQNKTTAATEATKQYIYEYSSVNQANMKRYVTVIVIANNKVIEKCLLCRIKFLNTDGKTRSSQSDPNKRNRERSTARSVPLTPSTQNLRSMSPKRVTDGTAAARLRPWRLLRSY